MSPAYHQGKIINILNQYLEYHNLPAVCRLNTEGVCSGLSALHARYILERKEDEFMDVLKYMLEKKHDAEWDEKVNRFVIEVLKLASPWLFSDTVGQAKAYQEIVVDGQYIKPAFTLGLVTPKENWVSIFSSINLSPGEAMLISSANHAISISRSEKGDYVVYDPNYSTGTKSFRSEEELINELSINVFHYSNTNIGLAIKIIRPINSPPKHYPTIKALYKKYINTHVTEGGATYDNITRYSLDFAAKLCDQDAITQLIKRKQNKGIKTAIEKLIIENESEILETLLPYASKQDSLHMLYLAAKLGRLESFYCILKHLGLFLETIINDPEQNISINLLNKAASSSNQSFLKSIIDCFNKNPSNLKSDADLQTIDTMLPAESRLIMSMFKRDKNNKDTIMHAICSRSAACLTLLLDTLDENNKVLTTEQQLEYLSLAIKQNNPIMVETLLRHGNNRIPKTLLETIELPYDVIKQTDIHLLKTLQKHGMNFSSSALAMIDQKEHRDIGLILPIGIMLMEFMDWLRDIWAKHITSHHTNKHLIFRTSPVNSEPKNTLISTPMPSQDN